jgi:hypothetical protein
MVVSNGVCVEWSGLFVELRELLWNEAGLGSYIHLSQHAAVMLCVLKACRRYVLMHFWLLYHFPDAAGALIVQRFGSQ